MAHRSLDVLLNKFRQAAYSGLRRFRRDEDGMASIDAIVWVPFFTLITLLGVDASVMMVNRGDMWRTAGETARLLSIGAITPAEAQTFANAYSIRGADYTVVINETVDSVSATISVPISTVAITSWFAGSTNTLSVNATYRKQNA